MLRVLSVCSGIGAAELAWSRLGWRVVGGADIAAFPNAVRAARFPDIPNWGDITRFQGWPDADVDVLVGGTPCQSFSVAGLRGGLADPRGNLALTYLAIADRYRPEWLVWENVPGVLSSGGGRDFGAFLGGLAELGYGFAYRVLDAQYHGVAQRRRRVFVVGHLGDWRRAAAVLFERESLCGHPPPRRDAGAEIAGTIVAGASDGRGWRLGPDEAAAHHITPAVAPCLRAQGQPSHRLDSDAYIVSPRRVAPTMVAFGGNDTRGPIDVATARTAHGGPHGRLDFESETFVVHGSQDPDVLHDTAHTLGRNQGRNQGQENAVCVTGSVTHALTAEGADASEDGSGRGTPLVAFSSAADLADAADDISPTLACKGGRGHGGGAAITDGFGVRRLTPRECERLQGFPDDWTAIEYRGRPAADGPRYAAIGNSMAVPVMTWIGRRITLVEALAADASAATGVAS